jgi:hypothetical protein
MLLQSMYKTTGILKNLNIPYWLDCGTLLFMYRDGKCDPTDVDFSIHEKDANRLLNNLHLFTTDGFELHRVYAHPEKGFSQLSMFYGGKQVDIFVKFFKGPYAYTISTKEDGNHLIGKYVKRHFESREKLIVNLDEWYVPCDTEEYLETYYGKDWRTPKSIWDWTKDALCIDERFKP